MKRTSPLQNRGFTLVELLVVIGIIALLISILLPSLTRANQAARSIKCQAIIKQFLAGDLFYLNANRGWHMPAFYGYYIFNRTWPGFYEFRKATALPVMDPVKDASIWTYVPLNRYCPEALRGATQSPSKTFPGFWVSPMNYSYGLNVEGVDDLATDPSLAGTGFDAVNAPYAANTLNNPAPTTNNWIAVHGYNSSKIKHSSDKLFMVDAMWIAVAEIGAGPEPGFMGVHSNYDIVGERTNTGTVAGGAYNSERTTAWRHAGRANVGFFDGHVASLRKDEIYSIDPTTGKIVGNDKLWKVWQ